MILVAGGDSFVWGSELPDHRHGGPDGYSNLTFFARQLIPDFDRYICAAYPGIGNRDIADRVISHLVPDCCVAVCWTWSTRDGEVDSDQHISKLQTYLELKRIPYIFTCADNCVITGKLDYTHWYMFPPSDNIWETTNHRGFYQWAVENKYKCGKENHPLEDAHRDAAQLIERKFYELFKKAL
jgi:hypothetical protein